MLLERIYEQGARGAEPGEFTARAFFNGALSLDEAESVGALIRARSDAQLRSAHALRNHAPARTAQVWSEQLAEVVALVEADIDFAEEPIEFITPGELIARLKTLRAELDALLCSADSVERFEVLPTVLLVGPANAGKSSLMNALSGVERAICSAVEGTTRDVLTAPLALPAMDCLLADGAGLNRTDDELLLLAQSMTRETAARVDLLCLVLDISREVPGDVFEILRHHPEKRAVIAANKTDLLGADVVGARIKRMVATASFPVIGTSAISGTGTTELRRAIQAQLGEDRGGAEDRSILLGTRQRNALRAASDALDRAITHSRAIDSTIERADLIAFDLREALEALAAVCGQVSTEDLLTQVFSRFCIGK
ncbi:MAG: GTP-binding protein [bacterium]|nr:GTP-binding protein [bacterium]